MIWMVGVYSSSFREQYPQLVEQFEFSIGGVEQYRPTYGLDIIPSPKIRSSYDEFIDAVNSNRDAPVYYLKAHGEAISHGLPG